MSETHELKRVVNRLPNRVLGVAAAYVSVERGIERLKEAKAALLLYITKKLTAATESKIKLESLLTEIEKLEA